MWNPAALEGELQSELEYSCSLRAGDLTECWIRIHPANDRSGIKGAVCRTTAKVPDRMVKSVERFEPEFEFCALGKEEALMQAEI